jgi:preprotein translocase subunit YajC
MKLTRCTGAARHTLLLCVAVVLLFAAGSALAQPLETEPAQPPPELMGTGTEDPVLPPATGEPTGTDIPVQDSGEAQGGEEAAPPPGCLGSGGIESMIPLLGMIAIIYFLIIRPQQKQQKRLRQMREALSRGDKIVTTGGIHGVVVNIKDDRIVVIKVADSVKLEIDRDAIGAVVTRGGGEEG